MPVYMLAGEKGGAVWKQEKKGGGAVQKLLLHSIALYNNVHTIVRKIIEVIIQNHQVVED